MITENSEILEEYNTAHNTLVDIHEHIPVLYEYALKSTSIIECGVRSCVSTWAFIRGLENQPMNPNEPKLLIGIDLDIPIKLEKIRKLATECNVFYRFWCGNDLKYTDNLNVDLIFIDTWHVYGHLKRELNKFALLAKKWIILHDTEIDGVNGESIRCRCNIEEQAKENNYSVEEIQKGLWPAVEEFISQNPNWVIEKHYKNCNGLTILKKIN